MTDDGESDGIGATGADWALSASGRETAEKFIREQTRLARLQADELVREDKVRHWLLRATHASTLLKLAFELSLALVLLVAVAIVIGAVWGALSDGGLVVEAFSVPPDLVARGLTGDVVATKLLDRLSAIQAQTASYRASSSYANNWGSDIKVQIPDTGVSIGEFDRFLHGWLGHQTRITGDIYRTRAGIAVTARAGSYTSPTFAGHDTDLDTLMQKAAESVYRATQPYRYAAYLDNMGRTKEAEAAYGTLIANGSSVDRSWAIVGLGNLYEARGDSKHALAMFRRALDLRPDFFMAYFNIQTIETLYQHYETALATSRTLVRLAEGSNDRDIDEAAWSLALPMSQAGLAEALGDRGAELKADAQVEALPEFNGLVENARLGDLRAYGALHDPAALRAAYADLPPSGDPRILVPRQGTLLAVEVFLGNPAPLLKEKAKIDEYLQNASFPAPVILRREAWPIEAYAMALVGHFASALRLVARTPIDCTVCLRLRGRIDAIGKNWAGAGFWFARAARFAPSSPFAYTDWGQMLLRKGDTDAAIEKFRIANVRGPHFADPLEMWGEALMQKNRSDLALAKFEEANKYAPRWGRLHLEWGKALIWSGDSAGAKKQFAIASKLDLSPQDKSQLRTMEQRI